MRSLWLVDAYNVLRVSLGRRPAPAVPDGPPEAEPREQLAPAWWSQSRRDHLTSLASRLSSPDTEICLVFDARHLAQAQEPGAQSHDASGEFDHEPAGERIRIVFAPSADDWIVSAVKNEKKIGRSGTRVVTADRVLANRVRSRGATIVPTDEFVVLCQQADGSRST